MIRRGGDKSRLGSVLRGLGCVEGDDVDPASVLVEEDFPFDQRKDRPIATDADVLAGPPFGAVLSADDASRLGGLAAEQLDSEHLGLGVATVAARTLTFLMRHRSAFPKRDVP